MVEHDPRRLAEIELAPFRAAIDENVATIMTAHVLALALDEHRPASFSPIVVDQWLKQTLGFQGVVVSDDLGMKAISATWALPEAMVQAISAGCDVALLCNSTIDEQVDALEAAIHAVESGAISIKRIDDAMATAETHQGTLLRWATAGAAGAGRDRQLRTSGGRGGHGRLAVTPPIPPPRLRSGLIKFRPLRPGGRIALVAPASSFDRGQFEAGVAEVTRLGFIPVFDECVFDRETFTAGTPQVRSRSLLRAFDSMDADAVIAVRGGYGSVELLPMLDVERIRRARTAFIGYSDVTSLHSVLNGAVGLASVHGPMIDGRLAKGTSAYDQATFLTSLSTEPLGELAPDGLEVIHSGTATGALVGGTLTQLLASFETPYAFRPPAPHVLFLDEVGERPYRLHRMLTQLRLSGRMASAAALVFGQLPRATSPAAA